MEGGEGWRRKRCKDPFIRPLIVATNPNDLVVREPSAQVIILARGELKHIGTLIEAADAADTANELRNVSPLPTLFQHTREKTAEEGR
jgi:hypothetical protein